MPWFQFLGARSIPEGYICMDLHALSRSLSMLAHAFRLLKATSNAWPLLHGVAVYSFEPDSCAHPLGQHHAEQPAKQCFNDRSNTGSHDLMQRLG